jgi:hypothetical protein
MMATREGVEAQEEDGAAFGFYGFNGDYVKLIYKDILLIRC